MKNTPESIAARMKQGSLTPQDMAVLAQYGMSCLRIVKGWLLVDHSSCEVDRIAMENMDKTAVELGLIRGGDGQ